MRWPAYPIYSIFSVCWMQLYCGIWLIVPEPMLRSANCCDGRLCPIRRRYYVMVVSLRPAMTPNSTSYANSANTPTDFWWNWRRGNDNALVSRISRLGLIGCMVTTSKSAAPRRKQSPPIICAARRSRAQSVTSCRNYRNSSTKCYALRNRRWRGKRRSTMPYWIA